LLGSVVLTRPYPPPRPSPSRGEGEFRTFVAAARAGVPDRRAVSHGLGRVPASRLDGLKEQIPSLDGLRAVAVGFVFLSHMQLVFVPGFTTAVTIGLLTVGGQQLTFAQGGFGVTVFFFLSGFLITTLLRIEHERTGRISLRDFYLRRVLRIFPPLYIALLGGIAATALGLVRGWPLTVQGVLSQALYLNNYYQIAAYPHFGAAAGSWVLWSLAIEEHFYLLFPLALLGLLRAGRSRTSIAAILLGVCALVLAWRLVLVFQFNVIVDRTYMGTDTRIDSLLFGCVLGLVENPVLDRSVISDRTWRGLLLPLGLVGIAATWFLGGVHVQETVRYTVQGLCLIPVFVCAVRHPDWVWFRPLNWAWVRFVGVVSYVVYLVHDTVLIGVQQHLHARTLVQGVVALAIVLVIAAAVRELVEKPCARLRRRLSHTSSARWPEPAGAVHAVARS
jgi:peptidoglycan/LPS O-acetylase OafA/YrhL